MIENSLLDKYIKESSFKMNEKSRQITKNFLTKFFNSKPDIDYADLTRQDMIEIFSASNMMSIVTFAPYKSKVNDFMKWMLEEGYGTEQLLHSLNSITFDDIDRSDFYDKYYFRDFLDLYNTMQKAFSKRGSEFDTFRSAAVLVWHGIKVRELPNILKSDINDDEGYVIHPVTKEEIFLLPLAIKTLVQYRDANTHDSSKFGGQVISYAEGPFLFRSYKSKQLTATQIEHLSNSANSVAKEIGKVFNWKRIYTSGLYNRIYQYEQENGVLESSDFSKLKVLFKMPYLQETAKSRALIVKKYRGYQEFKQNMYT